MGRDAAARKQRTFVLEWLTAVRKCDLSTAAVAVAAICATFADYGTGENMRAGNETIARASGLADRRTREMMAELRDAGLLLWDGVRTYPGRARCYRLTLPNRGGESRGLAKERRQRSAGDWQSTPAMSDTNGGRNQQERRQWAATHQGPTRARPRARSDERSPVNSHQFLDDGHGTCISCALPAGHRCHELVRKSA